MMKLIKQWFQQRSEIKIFKIASPCSQYWGDMSGDSKVRHCDLCNHDVNNVCAMSKGERKALMERRANGERVCVYIEPSFVKRSFYFASAIIFSVVTFSSYKSYLRSKYSDVSGILAAHLDESKFKDFGKVD